MAVKEDDIASNTLFIRNLPFTATNQTLEDVFSDIGPLKKCFVVSDKGKNTCRGIGYVQYSAREDAISAKKKITSVDGRNIFITFADRKHKKKRKKGDAEEQSEATVPVEEKKNEKTEKKPKPQTGKTVVLSGFDEGTELEHIQALLGDIKNSTNTEFPVPDRDSPTAFITFKSQKDAKKGINKLSGKKINGASLKAVLQSLDVKSVPDKIKKRSRLIVRNLSFKCNVDSLKSAFSKFGEITDVQIPTKPDGRKFGFGFVQFVRPNQASEAMQTMNAKPILGRPVAVDWAIAKDKYESAANSQKSPAPTSTKKGKKGEDDDDESASEDSSDDEEDGSDEEEEEKNGAVATEEEEESDAEIASDNDDDEEEESEEDESDNDDDEDDSEDENSDESDDSDTEEKKSSKKPAHSKGSADVDQGKTVFIRNLSYDTIEDDLQELMSEIGEVSYCKIVMDHSTEHSKGIAFVKFKTKEDADTCVKTSEDSSEDGGIFLDGRQLNITLAVARDKAEELKKEKKEKEPKDNRNLWLAREGMIRPGTQAAQGLPKVDLDKRMKVEQIKRAKLKNPQIFISTTRLCVRNIPVRVDEKELKKVILNAADDKTARVDECRIMRDMSQMSSQGVAKSRGFAFINFLEHKHALKALRQTNNNPDIFGDKKRLIVEFSLENKAALHAKEKRLQRHQTRVGALQKTGMVKRPKKEKKVEDRSILESEARPATKEKRKAAKALPSHWGAKVRHKAREPVKVGKQVTGRLSRKEIRQEKLGKRPAGGDMAEPAKKRRNRGKEVRDDFDRLVGKYKQKLSGSINKAAGLKTSKWFE